MLYSLMMSACEAEGLGNGLGGCCCTLAQPYSFYHTKLAQYLRSLQHRLLLSVVAHMAKEGALYSHAYRRSGASMPGYIWAIMRYIRSPCSVNKLSQLNFD